MKQRHTSGPWRLLCLKLEGFPKPGYLTRYDLDAANDIGQQSAGILEVFGDEGQANAKLIATAPEMLRVLIEVQRAIRLTPLGTPLETQIHEVVAKALEPGEK